MEGDDVRTPLTGFSVKNQIILTLCATTGSFAVGMALAWSSPVLPVLEKEMNLGLDEVSWIGSFLALGAVIGGAPGGLMMERLGRRTSLLYACLPFAFGWLFMIAHGSVYLFYIGRIIVGMVCGTLLVIVPTYIAETAHVSWRGKLGTLMQVMIVTGVLATYALGAVIKWQWLSVSCCAMVAVFAILISRMPESPAFLLKHGDEDGAREVLSYLRGPDYDVEPELNDIRREDEAAKRSGAAGLKDLGNPALYRPLLVSMGLMLNQQFSGVNNIIFYSASIFQAAGSSMDENVAAVIVGVAQVLATVCSAAVVDRLGRKPLLLASNLLGGVSLYAMGLYFYWKSNIDYYGEEFVTSKAWVPLVACISFIVAFSLALGPVPWLMMGELFPVKYRGLASGMATMLNWLAAFLTTKSFALLQASVGMSGAFWIYAGCVMVGALFVTIWVPETKGKSLNEISAYFGAAEASQDEVRD